MSVGETLKRAREQRGLSLEDVAAQTRIRSTLIRGIEADDFDPCGGAVYARGHIRSISRVVGVDPEPLVAEFDRVHDVEPPPVTVPAQPSDPEMMARAGRRRQPNWAAAMAVALVAICALAAVGLARSGGGGHKHGNSTLANAPNPKTSTRTSPTTPVSPPSSAVAQLPQDKASMLVRATHGYTWMSVTSKSGLILFQGTLPAGRQKLFTDKHGLSFVIGNAPAVDIVVNGHDIGSPHSAGNVSRGKVTPGADTVQQT